MRAVRMAMYVIAGPVRFLIMNGQILLASFLLSISVVPQNDYPWPGFISYHFPGLPLLFLGVLTASALLRLAIIHPITGWGTLFNFMVFSLATSFLLNGILPPPQSVAGMVAMAVVVWFIWQGFTTCDREKFIVRALIFTFGLIVLKFIFLKSPVFQSLLSIAGLPFAILAGESAPTAPVLSVYTEYIVFLAFMLYSCAMVLQFPFHIVPGNGYRGFGPDTRHLIAGPDRQLEEGGQRLIGDSSDSRQSLSFDGFQALPEATPEDRQNTDR